MSETSTTSATLIDKTTAAVAVVVLLIAGFLAVRSITSSLGDALKTAAGNAVTTAMAGQAQLLSAATDAATAARGSANNAAAAINAVASKMKGGPSAQKIGEEVEKRLATVFDSIGQKISGLATNLAEINASVSATGQKVDDLSVRVAALEAKTGQTAAARLTPPLEGGAVQPTLLTDKGAKVIVTPQEVRLRVKTKLISAPYPGPGGTRDVRPGEVLVGHSHLGESEPFVVPAAGWDGWFELVFPNAVGKDDCKGVDFNASIGGSKSEWLVYPWMGERLLLAKQAADHPSGWVFVYSAKICGNGTADYAVETKRLEGWIPADEAIKQIEAARTAAKK